MGPKEQEKMAETQKRKKTPAMERLSLREPVAEGIWEPMAASQTRAMLMAMVPKRRGLRRPTRSRRKVMKKKLKTGPTML